MKDQRELRVRGSIFNPTRRSANLNAPGVVSCSAAKAEERAGVALRRKALQTVSNRALASQ
jgi:hypothetical protein